MIKERLYIFDTTLRDGAQTQGVDFSVEDKRQIALALAGGLGFLGFSNVQLKIAQKMDNALATMVADAIEARATARKKKDFKESDRIRDDLLAKGIVLKDGAEGTSWEVKR